MKTEETEANGNGKETQTEPAANSEQSLTVAAVDDGENGDVGDVQIDIEVLDDPQFSEYKNVLSRFQAPELEDEGERGGEGQIFYSDDEDGDEPMDDADAESDDEATRISKRRFKQINKKPVAELKASARIPELVEWYDADAPDPELLVELKTAPGVVQVPDHWRLKREYLSQKKGFKKAPFDLPDAIKATGIMEMRDSLAEDERTLRQRTRERVQPKMGRLDIDYQKLHDAFFKFQTKPRMYGVGDVYYEGKEHEIDFRGFRPGQLSRALKQALNIPALAPPPWLINMQRYGPPPSYPGLQIPGLNAPIPAGAQWGFQPGGWGRPPVNAQGEPLFGDVYGAPARTDQPVPALSAADRELWGQMAEDESESGEDEQEDEGDEEMEQEDEGAGYVDEDAAQAAAEREGERHDERKPLSAADVFELRKKRTAGNDNDDDEAPVPRRPKRLYQELRSKSGASGFMGTGRAYDLDGNDDDNAEDDNRRDFMAGVESLMQEQRERYSRR